MAKTEYVVAVEEQIVEKVDELVGEWGDLGEGRSEIADDMCIPKSEDKSIGVSR